MNVHIQKPKPLPPYTDPRSALKMALPALRPAAVMSVTDAAEKYMRVNVGGQWQPFRRDVTPYMIEPADMMASRAYRGLVFCGPSQSGKTQMLQSVCAHAIMCDPSRIALFQMTRDAASEFEKGKIAPMIRNSPKLRARQETVRGADNLHQKLYKGGTHLSLDWPTITKLSSATIRLLLGTDYDHWPESIGGEGDGYTMMRARAKTLMSRGMVGVESSPGAPITDETWKPKSKHDCPPVRYGVLALYPQGTRARWYWTCPDCDKEFEPTFKRLKYPKDVTPAEAGEVAEMACPHCGVLIGHHMKRELNAHGRWLHEADDGTLVPIDSPKVRKTDLLSYWLDGAAAAFSTWVELVTQYEQALDRFKATGDEEALKTAMNTGQAQPYMPRGSTSENEVTLQGLKDKAVDIDIPKGIAPSWTRYITVSVDTQAKYFPVGVTAWGVDGRHQPIDRFELHTPPEGAPNSAGDRTLRPDNIGEDWAVLDVLPSTAWPVEGSEYGLRPIAIGVDMHGGGQTTTNAYKFYRGRRKAGEQSKWFLTRGSGGQHTDRVWLKAPERTNNAGRKVASDIKILNMATDRLKDAMSSSLCLETVGQNYCGIPMWMDENELLEFTAERLGKKGWEKRPGMVRNESIDHLVQARALHIIKGGEKINWAAPPNWARDAANNINSVKLAGEATPTIVEKEAPRRRVPRKLF